MSDRTGRKIVGPEGMTMDAEGFTPPGPILWEVTEYDISGYPNRAVKMIARTPEHPATDRRFSLYEGESMGDGCRVWYGADATNPENPERYTRGALEAMTETDTVIRAAWYEGGGGYRQPATRQAERLAAMARALGARTRVRYFAHGEINHHPGQNRHSGQHGKDKNRPNHAGWFYDEREHGQWVGPYPNEAEARDEAGGLFLTAE